MRLDFRAMGCQMLVLIDSDTADATEMLAQVPTWFEAWEQSLSRFRDDSELNALNRADGEPMRVSETLWQVLDASIAAARESAGLVTPTVLDAVHAAGYTTSFDMLVSSAKAAGALASKPIIDWRAIERDEKKRSVRLPQGMHLDFGGVAKGWAADQAAQRLSVIAPVMIDAGGDIAISASRSNGEPWSIGLANPFEPESGFGNLDDRARRRCHIGTRLSPLATQRQMATSHHRSAHGRARRNRCAHCNCSCTNNARRRSCRQSRIHPGKPRGTGMA